MRKIQLILFTVFSAVISISLHAANPTPFKVFYPLNATTTITPTITGNNVIASNETLVDWNIGNYNTAVDVGCPYANIVTSADRIQRINRVDDSSAAIAWPNDATLNPNRYVQFSITPSKDYFLTVDSIGLYLGGSGSGSIRLAAMASTDSNFAAANTDTLFYSTSGNTNNYIYPAFSTKRKIVEYGNTLYVRAYFWINADNQNRMGLIKNVTIRGTVSEVEIPVLPMLTSFKVDNVNGVINQSEKTITVDIESSNPVFSSLSSVATYFTTQDEETTITIGSTSAITGDGIDYSNAGNGLENIPVILTNNVGSATYNLTIRKYTAFSVLYPLSSTTTISPVITGKVTALNENFSNADALDYASTAGIILAPGDTLKSALSSIQRCGLPNNVNWPQESELNPDRYIEFAVTPKAGTTLIVDSIGLYIGGATSGGVKFTVRTSTSSDFNTYNTIIERIGTTVNANGYVYPASFTQQQYIDEGKMLYIRAYFWQTGTAAARRFLIKNVAIAGKVLFEDDGGFTSIAITESITEPVTVRYYNLQGIEVVNPLQNNIYIVKKIYNNNTVKTEKILKK